MSACKISMRFWGQGMSDNPLNLTLREAVDWVAHGKISAVELLDEAVSAIGRYDKITNAVIGLTLDRARAEAKALDQLPVAARGPLHGVPLAHKDMYYRKDEITSCGAKAYSDRKMTQTGTLLRRLDGAGAVSFARLNMAQFAMGPTGHNPDFGRCCNPFVPERISGGSSSGTAAAVAARYAFGALGSDTGGSVRLPAALCGVVGLKPTQGLLPLDGVMGLSESLDTPGPVARSSGDIARLMDVMLPGTSHETSLSQGLSGLTVGVPRQYYTEGLDPEVARNFDAALTILKSLGAKLLSVDLPDHQHYADLADAIWKPEAAALHFDTLRDRPEVISAQARSRLAQGLGLSAVGYVRARQMRGLALQAMLDGALSQCDVLITPAIRILPPLATEVEAAAGDAMRRNLEALTAFSRPLNFLGLPGLTTPSGFASSGAPLSVQLIGRPRQEADLLRLGEAFERETGFVRQRPAFLGH